MEKGIQHIKNLTNPVVYDFWPSLLTETNIIIEGLKVISEFKRRIQRKKCFHAEPDYMEHTIYSSENKFRAQVWFTTIHKLLNKLLLRPWGNSQACAHANLNPPAVAEDEDVIARFAEFLPSLIQEMSTRMSCKKNFAFFTESGKT